MGIGASAGGLQAMEALFRAMPTETGAAFVLVAHLAPRHRSYLPELLQKNTTMLVHTIEHRQRVLPDNIYVIPPNCSLTISRGLLHLEKGHRAKGEHLPIDSFFESLARDQGPNAVGIILSGNGNDGTRGIHFIKEKMGMVLAQDPETAKYPSMPQKALESGLVDYAPPPERMPQVLRYWVSHGGGVGPHPTPENEAPISDPLKRVFAILRDRTGNDFSHYKPNTIDRRLQRRMDMLKLDSLDAYARFLDTDPLEADTLYHELLIGVTSFFRDPLAFQSLRRALVQNLERRPDGNQMFRAWVTGCATGEEAYSIAMTLFESVRLMGHQVPFQVFATDLNEDDVGFARTGIYPASSLDTLAPDLVQRFFTRLESGQYQIKKLIREKVVFAKQNLIKDPPFTKIDLLCCRNLLIYLRSGIQKKLYPIFHYSLRSEGLLFLGSSETVGSASNYFVSVDKKWKIYRRVPLESRLFPHVSFPLSTLSPDNPRTVDPTLPSKADELSILKIVESILKESDSLPCVVISRDLEVLYVHGRTGDFLELPQGETDLHLIRMARPGLRSDLSSAVQKVIETNQQITSPRIPFDSENGTQYLTFVVKPAAEQNPLRGPLIVVFDQSDQESGNAETAKTPTRKNKPSVESLEYELSKTRDDLQATIEELETSNEELKSTNEELQSTNEELQSTNEELETSKEELQSLNEESATVNTELQARVDELCTINDDMKNLLDSTAVAAVFLDTEFKIRGFTPTATKIIPLTATDRGRPINDLANSLVDTDLLGYGRKVLEDLGVIEAEIESRDGRSYTLRVRPYRTLANVIDGVVFTFEDCTERNQVRRALEKSQRRHRQVFEMSVDPMVLVETSTGTIVEFNSQAIQSLGFSEAEFTRLKITDFWPGFAGFMNDRDDEGESQSEDVLLEQQFLGKNGEPLDLMINLQAFRQDDEGFGLLTWRKRSP